MCPKHSASYSAEFIVAHLNNVFISDNAANMKAAFRDSVWLGCSCHNINLGLTHGLKWRKEESGDEHKHEGLPLEVGELIETCKELVTLEKRTKINSKLQMTLKQCMVTR